MGQELAEVHKLAKKERGQYPVLAEQTWLIKDLLYGFWVVPSGQDSCILLARVPNHSTGFDSYFPLTELTTYVPKIMQCKPLEYNFKES